MSERTVLSLFSGAGGLDLGFELEGFKHVLAMDNDEQAVQTLQHNRPSWGAVCADVRDFRPTREDTADVLVGGFPCQGFSLGGHRLADDERNVLYAEMIRVAAAIRPRVVVLENVLNLRTMIFPRSGKPFATQIAGELEDLGYTVSYDIFKVCHFGAPQTRRRFVFVAFLGKEPSGYHLPQPGPVTPARAFLGDLADGSGPSLQNHDPRWGFRSKVHEETGEPFNPAEAAVPVRLSRTASDGNPVRSLDSPFPAIDTGTIWGWAQGNVTAGRFAKDRMSGPFVRDPEAAVSLWRIRASRIRAFTAREYARLQTFPDDWFFVGKSRRDLQMQVGNAVPVSFAQSVARNVRLGLDSLDGGRGFEDPALVGSLQLTLEG